MKPFMNPGVYEADQIEVGQLTEVDIAALQNELISGVNITIKSEE
jgi:hypothetical protein